LLGYALQRSTAGDFSRASFSQPNFVGSGGLPFGIVEQQTSSSCLISFQPNAGENTPAQRDPKTSTNTRSAIPSAHEKSLQLRSRNSGESNVKKRKQTEKIHFSFALNVLLWVKLVAKSYALRCDAIRSSNFTF
jgi:hypothetical protein